MANTPTRYKWYGSGSHGDERYIMLYEDPEGGLVINSFEPVDPTEKESDDS